MIIRVLLIILLNCLSTEWWMKNFESRDAQYILWHTLTLILIVHLKWLPHLALDKHVFTFWDNNISLSLLSLDVNLDADISDILYKHCSKYNWCGLNRLGSLVHRVMFIRHQMEENGLKQRGITLTSPVRNVHFRFTLQNILTFSVACHNKHNPVVWTITMLFWLTDNVTLEYDVLDNELHITPVVINKYLQIKVYK